MARRIVGAVLVTGLIATLAGCELTRKNYQAVSLGQNQDDVKKVLGEPRYKFEGQWIWTRDDPRDLTKVGVYFDEENKVIGKSWQNPERPWENHREGQVPESEPNPAAPRSEA